MAKAEEARLAARVAVDLATATVAVWREEAAREETARAVAARAAARAAVAIEVGLRLLLQIGERVELLQIGLSWVEVHANHFGGALVALRRVVDGFCIGGVDPKVEDAPARPEDAPKACDELVVTCERRERKPGVGDKDELRNRASDGRRTQLDRVQLVLLRLRPPTSRPSP